jgi:hypothetical protein
MRRSLMIPTIVGVLTACLSSSLAAQSVTQVVTFSVAAISVMSVSGNPGALNITTATPGSAPTSVSDASTTYAITTNETSKKIVASIDANMPSGLTLTVALQAPAGATSAGAVSLTTAAADAVNDVSTVNASGRTITYTLAATTAAGVVSSTSRTVTLTVVVGP